MADTTCTRPPAGWHCTRAAGHEGPCAAAPKPQWPQLDKIIDAHVDGYELHGENEAGFDVRYDPTDHERLLIRDAIAGLLADPDWAAAWGRHVNEIVAARVDPQQENGAPAPSAHADLMRFYNVDTPEALIAAQADHIAGLQSKLQPAPSLAPQRVREG